MSKPILILLIDDAPNLVDQVKDYASTTFNIDRALFDITTMSIYRLPRDEGYTVDHLSEYTIISDYYGISGHNVKRVDDITDIASIAEIAASCFIKPKTWWTDELETTKLWLEKVPEVVSIDFETTGLRMPFLETMTMMSIGLSYTKSVVIVFSSKEIEEYCMNWLVTTKRKQIYHNSSFDVRYIYNRTKQFPMDFEDSMLLARVYVNSTNKLNNQTGLKYLAGNLYSDWANSKESFELYEDSTGYTNDLLVYKGSSDVTKYNRPLIYYAGTDGSSTLFVYNKFNIETPNNTEFVRPASEPKDNTENFNRRDYYEFVTKPFIPVLIKMLERGLSIDLDKVKILQTEVEEIKQDAVDLIVQHPIVQEYQAIVDKVRVDKFLGPIYKSMKHPKYTGYKNTVAMRTFVVNRYCEQQSEKITAIDLKSEYYSVQPITKLLLDKQYTHPAVVSGANAFEEYTCYEQNVKANRIDKINNPHKYVDVGFNPYNYKQLAKMWEYLGLTSEEFSKKTKEMSFSKEVISNLAKTETDEALAKVLFSYLDIAEGKNILTNYAPKYLGSTHNGRVYGNLKILGTISGRLSGKADISSHETGINLVTQPASASKYAKPVKRCFNAPKGRILFGSDFNNLEGHISGILTKDKTKLAILKGEYADMHTLHACYYFKTEIEQKFSLDMSEVTPQIVEDLFHNKDFKDIRSNGKRISFGLDYGSFPPKIVSQLGCTLAVAQGIFDRYHYELYIGVSEFRENYVLPTAVKNHEIHLNWGLHLKSSNPKSDIRTLFNSCFQSFSDLTQIAAVDFENRIMEDSMQDRVMINNCIHDAIYGELDDDLETIKWVNDNLITVMTKPFVHNQSVQLKSECDIGYNLYDVLTLPNNCSIEHIEQTLTELRK